MTLKRSAISNQSSRLSRNPAVIAISASDAGRERQLADIAATGDEDNAEVCRAELEQGQMLTTHLALPYQGKLTASLLQKIPFGAYIISMCCQPDGSSLFAAQVGIIAERHTTWTAIREAGANQRNCLITMDGNVAEIMARPFPTGTEERTRDIELRSAMLSEQHSTIATARTGGA